MKPLTLHIVRLLHVEDVGQLQFLWGDKYE